jgi:hypothetical protein
MAFRRTVDGIAANLVELDADMTRQLLDASTGLSGKTAAVWADASERLTRLWQGQLALRQVEARIDDMRDGRRSVPPRVLEAIVGILEGPSVELPAPPDRGRRLTSAAPATEAWTVENAIESLSGDYDAVMDVVAQVGRIWGDVTDQMAGLATELSDLGRLAGQLELGLSNELAFTRRALEEAEETARTDPLAFQPSALEVLCTRVHRARQMVDGAMRERDASMRDCDALDSRLAEAAALLAECDSAFGRLKERVVVPAAEWAKLDSDRRELERLQDEGQLVRRTSNAPLIHGLAARVDALLRELRRLGGVAASGVEHRDELRGLLEAYRAKAQAFGIEERPEIEEQYAALRALLYNAPCDLSTADNLLTKYRRAINGSGRYES